MRKIDSSSDDADPRQTQASPEQMSIDFDYVPTWWPPQLVASLLSHLSKTTAEVTYSTRQQAIQVKVDKSVAEAAQISRSSTKTSQRRDAEVDRFEEARDKAVYETLLSEKEEHNKKRA